MRLNLHTACKGHDESCVCMWVIGNEANDWGHTYLLYWISMTCWLLSLFSKWTIKNNVEQACLIAIVGLVVGAFVAAAIYSRVSRLPFPVQSEITDLCSTNLLWASWGAFTLLDLHRCSCKWQFIAWCALFSWCFWIPVSHCHSPCCWAKNVKTSKGKMWVCLTTGLEYGMEKWNGNGMED